MDQDIFAWQTMLLKIVSMQPLSFAFVPPKLNYVRYILNFLFYLFWHLILIHLAILQTETFLQNLDKSLDEVIDYVMIGSIYIYGYFILCHWQLSYKKRSELMNFVREKFHQRSAKGKMNLFKKKAF